MKFFLKPLWSIMRSYEGRYAPPSQKACVVVLGMQRGGTSLVCDLIHRLGVSFGDTKHHMWPDERNPRGFYEDVRLKNALLSCTREAGYTYALSEKRPLRALGFQNKVARFFSRLALIRILRDVATSGDSAVWGVKSFPIFYYFLKPYLPANRKVVAVYRHPFAVAASFQSAWGRGLLPFNLALDYWTRGMEDVIAFCADERDVLLVRYEDLVDTKTQSTELDRIHRFIGQGNRDALSSVVSEKLNRSSHTVSRLHEIYPLPQDTKNVLYALDTLRASDTM